MKTEASTSQHVQKFHYPLMRVHEQQHHQQQQQQGNESSGGEVEDIKAKIMAHPQYSNLLEAYMDCQKVYIRTLKETRSVSNEVSGLMFDSFKFK